MNLKEKGTISTQQAFLKGFNGQAVTLYVPKDTTEPVAGKSGNTHLYSLDGGKGLFLTQDEVA